MRASVGRAAAAPSAMRAAPVLSGRSFASECEAPSGKTPIAPPLASTARATPNVWRFCAGSKPASCRRDTGMASNARQKKPITGIRNSGALARNDTRRGARQSRNAGSTRPLGWFNTNITGPRAGTCADPETSIRRKKTLSTRPKTARTRVLMARAHRRRARRATRRTSTRYRPPARRRGLQASPVRAWLSLRSRPPMPAKGRRRGCEW